MAVYVGIYWLLVVSGSSRERSRSVGSFYFWLFFLLVFAGTREWTGCDFSGYLNRFEVYASKSIIDVLFEPEQLFSLLVLLLHEAGLDFMWLNVIASFVTLAGFFAFARRTENPTHFLALSFPILIVQLMMSGIRQAMALGVLLLALNAFRDGRRIYTLALVILASQFHSSAIVFAPLALIAGKDPSIKTLIAAAVIVAPVAVYLSAGRFETYQSRYVGTDVEAFGAVFRVALIAITAVFFELYRERYAQLYPHDFPLMRVFSILSFAVIATFAVSTLAAHRLGYYIFPVHILMLLRLPAVLQSDRYDPLLPLLPFIAYGGYVTVWFSLSRHARICYIPYDSYLF